MEENNQNPSVQKEAENPAPAPESIVIETLTPEEAGGFSLKKWWLAGILIAILNPVFAGLILGALLMTEPKLRKIGAVVVSISVIWGSITYFLLDKYWSVNFLGV